MRIHIVFEHYFDLHTTRPVRNDIAYFLSKDKALHFIKNEAPPHVIYSQTKDHAYFVRSEPVRK